MYDGGETLQRFERQADALVERLSLWRLPLRSVLSQLFGVVDSISVGGRFDKVGQPDVQRGSDFLSRISYLAPFLSRCTLDIGSDAENALSAFRPRETLALPDLAAYMHLCELMPEVHRGYYRVEVTEKGFALEHKNDDFRTYEERDILLTELSRAFRPLRNPHDKAAFDRLISTWPTDQFGTLLSSIMGGYRRYLSALMDTQYLPDSVYEESFSFSRDDFVRVRACLSAIGDSCLNMCDAAERQYMKASRSTARKRFSREYLEWVAPLLTTNFVYGTIQGTTGVSDDRIDAVLRPFTIDAESGDFGAAGDGYLPPLVRIEESYLFSPYGLQVMLAERNLLYMLNRLDRTTFDNLVERHLEPQLLDEAALILETLPEVIVKKNVKYRGGEIDLVAYDPGGHTAIHIQAKAAIPPQGARMTRQIESRTLRAIEQSNSFANQSPEVRDKVCSDVIGYEVRGVKWVPAILSRSGFGTARAWTTLGDITPLNVPLLRASCRKINEDGGTLASFAETTRVLFEGLVDETVERWRQGRIVLFGTKPACHFWTSTKAN
jgi:Holliday junction resolvase-like predicted endonuclease